MEKRTNVVPIHKKGGKQKLKNYRPILLLSITGKILERLLYDRMLESLTENNQRRSQRIFRYKRRANL